METSNRGSRLKAQLTKFSLALTEGLGSPAAQVRRTDALRPAGQPGREAQ